MRRYLLLPWHLLRRPLRPRAGPLHVQLEPTDACNQRCVMCTRDRIVGKPTFLPREVLAKVLREIRPRKLNLSGLGEPFLHPEIFAFLADARAAGAGVTLATNFTRLAGRVDELIASGIQEVKVSLDAADSNTYNSIRKGAGNHGQVLETLRELKARKAERGANLPVVRLNYALQTANLEELAAVARAAPGLGAASLYVQYLDYVDMEDRKGPLVAGLTADRLRGAFREAQAACREAGITSNLDIWLRDLELYLGKIGPPAEFRPNRRICFFPWISTFIHANGDVRPCPIFVWRPGEGIVGNVRERPFREIWLSPAYQEVRRHLRRGRKVLTPCRQCIPQSLGNIYALFTRLHPGWNRAR